MLRTPKHAWEGALQLLVGGEAEALERARPALETASEKNIPAGALGNKVPIALMKSASATSPPAVQKAQNSNA